VPRHDALKTNSRQGKNSIYSMLVFTAVTMKIAVFWDLVPCRSSVNRRFGGTYRLHLQGRKIRERGTSVCRWLQTESSVENTQVAIHKIHITFIILREYLLRVILNQSRDSSVGIATGYGMNDRVVGVRVSVGSRIFSSPRRPDWIWGSPNLPSNRYRK
jgi:hypothetical protein